MTVTINGTTGYNGPISSVGSISSSGNLTFTGVGAVIAGDFSNATLLSRTVFQTTTANSSTGIYALPSGTSTAASWQATNAADPTNASKILIATNGSTDVQLVSGRNGTGTYLPLSFYTNGSQQMLLDTSGQLGIGTTPSSSMLHVKGNWVSGHSTVKVQTVLAFASGGTAGYGMYDSDGTRCAFVSADSTAFQIYGQANKPTYFTTNSAYRMQLASGGQFEFTTSGSFTTVPITPFHIRADWVSGYGAAGIQAVTTGAATGLSLFNAAGTRMGYFNTDTNTGNMSLGNNANAPLIFETNNSEKARITSSGNVLIGQTSSQQSTFQLEAGNGGAAGARIGTIAMGRSGGDYPYVGYNFAFTGTSGSYIYAANDYASGIYFYVGGIYTYTANTGTGGNALNWSAGPYVARGGTSWTNASDERLKDITGEIQNGLAKVCALRAATYTWKADEGKVPQIGLIAQNVLGIVPEAVVVPEAEFNGKPETAMGVNYDRLIPVLVKAIQELKAEFDAYKLTHP